MIESLNTLSQYWYNWNLGMFWQVGLLIAIVWGIDLAIRKWAHPQVRYALWMLVLIKLLIPPTFTSPTSVTSHVPTIAQKAVTIQLGQPELPQTEAAIDTEPVNPERAQPYSSPPLRGGVPRRGEGVEIVSATNPDQIDTTQKAEVVSLESTEAKPAPSWKAYAMLTWLIGVIVLSIWLVIRLSVLRREHVVNDANTTLPKTFNDLLQSTAAKLNLRKLPQVILTDKVACPAVFGLFRPVLLMPAAKFKTMSQQDTEHILLHELAHIKRGDLLVHAIWMCLQILYWFNPLLWMIRKTQQNLRELCCDASVAKLLKDKTCRYRQTLLDTARQLLAEPIDPGLGLLGLFENSNWLVTRLAWLEKNTWKNRKLRIATIIALVAVMTTCVLPMANRSSRKMKVPFDKELSNSENVSLKRIRSKGHSISMSRGNDRLDYKSGTLMNILTTASNDRYPIVQNQQLPEGYYEVHAKGATYFEDIMEVYSDSFGLNVSIRPIEMEVYLLTCPDPSALKIHKSDETQSRGFYKHTENGRTGKITDFIETIDNIAWLAGYYTRKAYEQSKRSFLHVAFVNETGLEGLYEGKIESDVTNADILINSLKSMGFTITKARRTVEAIVIETLIAEGKHKVTGTVTDADTGLPIENAEVFDDGYNKNKFRTKTDDEGSFTLATANEEHNISAKAPGYTTQTKTLTTFPFANNENFNFQLTISPALSGVILRVLQAEEQGDNRALRLCDGTFIDLEESPTDDTPLLQWARVAGDRDKNAVGISADNLKLVELPLDFETIAKCDTMDDFEIMLETNYEQQLKQMQQDRDENWIQQRNWFIGPKPKYPYVVYFLGNDGTEGILEVSKIQDSQIHVRYKILPRNHDDKVASKLTQNSHYKTRHFVRLVVGENEKMTFQGEPTTLDQLPGRLQQIPNKDNTVLQVAFTQFPDKPRNDHWWYNHPAWQKADQLVQEYNFDYLSFVGKHPHGTPGSGSRNYLFIPMQLNEPITVNLPSAEPKPLIHLKTVTFADNKAIIAAAVTSYPKTHWDIELAFFDENEKRLDYVFKNYQNSGVIAGVEAISDQTIEIDLTNVKDWDKAKTFELSIKQSEIRQPAFKNIALRPGRTTDIYPSDFSLHCDAKRRTCNLVVSIQNQTDATLPQHKIRYYRGDPKKDLDETGNPHSGWHNAGPIEPNKSWNETTRAFFLSDGEYTFTVVLDYDNAITETNEENNSATLYAKLQDGRIIDQKLVSEHIQRKPADSKILGIGSGWWWIQRIVGNRYGGSIGGYSADEAKCTEYFDKVLSWSHPGDTFIMTFAFDEESYGHTQLVPKAYEDLLPIPWDRLKSQIDAGQTVEATGTARGLKTLLLAAPNLDQLETLIKNTEHLKSGKNSSDPIQKMSPALTEKTIAYWPFDGDAKDRISNNHGTVYGAALTEGISGQAYYFEGDGDCISIPTSQQFEFGDNDFTISAWFKTSVNKSPFPFIINFRQDDNNPHLELYASRHLGTHLYPGDTRVTYSDAGINDDRWHHVAITLSNGQHNGFKLYLDGLPAGAATHSGRLENWDTITIGAQKKGTNGQHAFEGLIDEVAIYNYPLSQEEIKHIYETVKGTFAFDG